MPIGTRALIQTPAVGANRRGLLGPGGAIDLPLPDDRWLAGATWEGPSCDAVGPRPIVCDETDAKPADTGVDGVRVADAFYVLGADRCSTLGRTPEEGERLARENLRLTESFQAEQEFWSGVASLSTVTPLDNFWLTRYEATEQVGEDALGYVDALAALDAAYVTCGFGAQGMIHASPRLVAAWYQAGLLRVDGTRLLTVLDNIVVAGAGYDGSGPATTDGGDPTPPDPGTEWAYATGLVYVARGEVSVVGDVASRIDRADNTLTTYAERPMLLAVAGCCALSVLADMTTPGAGLFTTVTVEAPTNPDPENP
jgi:hypothetical protein